MNSVTSTFAYCGDGLCDARNAAGQTKTFTWDVAAGLPVIIDDGAQYLYGNGLISQLLGGTKYYYLSDGLGSVTCVAGGPNCDCVQSFGSVFIPSRFGIVEPNIAGPSIWVGRPYGGR